MGHLFKKWEGRTVLVELGTQDWENRVVRVWDYLARSVILDKTDMEECTEFFREAIDWIEQENREKAPTSAA